MNQGQPPRAAKGMRGNAITVMFPAEGDLDEMIAAWLLDNGADFEVKSKKDNAHMKLRPKWATFQRGPVAPTAKRSWDV